MEEFAIIEGYVNYGINTDEKESLKAKELYTEEQHNEIMESLKDFRI